MLHYLTSPSDINVICLIHMQREGTVVKERSTACHGVHLVLHLNKKVLKFLVFISNISVFFSLCFKTSVDVFLILFNCSVSMTFTCLWKALFKLLKCWHASMALGFFMSILWLFNLMWEGVSDFSTYCILQSRHFNK